MKQIWLRSNRRFFGVLTLIFAIPLLGFVALSVWARTSLASQTLFWASACLAVAALVAILLIQYASRIPRLSYEGDTMFVNLGDGVTHAIPVNVVECFFLGQGPSLLPAGGGEKAETSNIIVRLAEAAEEWKHRDVKPSMGLWCEGYITIRGSWCEPITGKLITEMNGNLVAAHRKQREAKAAEAAAEAS